MGRIAVFFAEGFEEVEALSVVDVCRRLKLTVDMVSVDGEPYVKSSHGVVLGMDRALADLDWDSYDMLVLPGGMPGTRNLEANECLMQHLDEFYADGKYIGAICAAPSIFGHRGYLKGRTACCYPSFESELEGATVTAGPVEIDGRVVTSRGMGTAIEFGLTIARLFVGEEQVDALAKGILYDNVVFQ